MLIINANRDIIINISRITDICVLGNKVDVDLPGDEVITLGYYGTKEKAMSVLKEILTAYENEYKVYAVPKE